MWGVMIMTDAGPSFKSALPLHFCLAQHHLLARIQVSIITRTCQIIFTVSDFANIERFPNCPNILCYEDPPDPLYRIPSTTPFIEFLPLLIEKIVLPCILHQLSHIWENENPPPLWIWKKCFFFFPATSSPPWARAAATLFKCDFQLQVENKKLKTMWFCTTSQNTCCYLTKFKTKSEQLYL